VVGFLRPIRVAFSKLVLVCQEFSLLVHDVRRALRMRHKFRKATEASLPDWITKTHCKNLLLYRLHWCFQDTGATEPPVCQAVTLMGTMSPMAIRPLIQLPVKLKCTRVMHFLVRLAGGRRSLLLFSK